MDKDKVDNYRIELAEKAFFAMLSALPQEKICGHISNDTFDNISKNAFKATKSFLIECGHQLQNEFK